MPQSPRVTHCKLFAPPLRGPVSKKQAILWSKPDRGKEIQEYFFSSARRSSSINSKGTVCFPMRLSLVKHPRLPLLWSTAHIKS